ncbi:TPA: MAE_28990/MAE_18760 family HEPN-like nuclease [Pseudomonas aeruginosa]
MAMDCYTALQESLSEVGLIVGAAREALQEGGEGRVKCNAMTRAGLVLLCGYFEGFIRDLVEEYVEALNDEGVSVGKLPDSLFCSVLEGGVASYRGNSLASLNGLKETIVNGGTVKLNSKLLSKTGGNPSVDNVESIFSGIGIDSVIDRLSILDYSVDSTYVLESQVDAKFRRAIEAAIAGETVDDSVSRVVQIIEGKWQPRKKRRKVGYVSEIEELLKKRNRIAHGEGREQITPDDLEGHCNMVSKLSTGLHDAVSQAWININADPGGA